MKSVLIIGYGIVGHNLAEEIKDLNLDIIDKYKPELNKYGRSNYDIGFICVDTPLKENMLDITEVENAIEENDCDIYVIKSTIPVGTVDSLIKKTNKHIIFSPEYYGNTKHCNNYDFDFTILGGNKEDCNKVIDVIQKCYDGRHRFIVTESKLAELVKFMENSWIATKVSFCNEFNNICNMEYIDYNELRELFIEDPRVNSAHTQVYKDQPYWDSHCLNKDVNYIANQYNSYFLKNIIKFNENQKMQL